MFGHRSWIVGWLFLLGYRKLQQCDSNKLTKYSNYSVAEQSEDSEVSISKEEIMSISILDIFHTSPSTTSPE